MVQLSSFMTDQAFIAGNISDALVYSNENKKIKANLENMIYNEETGLYTDFASYQYPPK
jgi:hypothetical protein